MDIKRMTLMDTRAQVLDIWNKETKLIADGVDEYSTLDTAGQIGAIRCLRLVMGKVSDMLGKEIDNGTDS